MYIKLRIYLTGNIEKFDQSKQYLLPIREYLKESGHILTWDWVRQKMSDTYDFDKDENNTNFFYTRAVKALNDADLLLVESTIESTNNGYLISLALQKKLPILLLYKVSRTKPPLKFVFEGLDTSLLTILALKNYDQTNLKKEISFVLQKYKNRNTKSHFHLVLDNLERYYLEFAEVNYNENKTDIIREILDQQIKRDRDFEVFLKRSGGIPK
jgi:hypothetical protein